MAHQQPPGHLLSIYIHMDMDMNMDNYLGTDMCAVGTTCM